MTELLKLLDKEVRLSFERKGMEQVVRVKLRQIKDDKLLIGGIWVQIPKYYRIEEHEFKGSRHDNGNEEGGKLGIKVRSASDAPAGIPGGAYRKSPEKGQKHDLLPDRSDRRVA